MEELKVTVKMDFDIKGCALLSVNKSSVFIAWDFLLAVVFMVKDHVAHIGKALVCVLPDFCTGCSILMEK